jgi:hypothetical protein
MITLEYSSTRKSLSYWGITLDSASVTERNLAPSVLSLTRVGDSISSAAAFPYRGKVVIRIGESGSDGAGWSGGTVDFIGYRLRHLVQSSGNGLGVTYQFANAWHFLEQTPYVQFFATRDNDGEVLTYKQVPELLLFTALDGSNALITLNSGEQAEAILQMVLDAFTAQGLAQPFIIGDIDPALVLPSYQTRQVMCGAAILKCLELSPDVNSVFDYTTDVATVPTPTIHFKSRASQTPVDLALHNGVDHKSIAIEARPDLKPSSVVVWYKITGSDTGAQWVVYLKDKYGPNGQSHASDPDYGLDVLTQFIDLQGRQTTTISADVKTVAVDATHATDATRIAWWKQKSPKLASDKIAGIVLTAASVTVKDQAGTTVSLATYPNELTGGNLADWTTKTAKWVTIKCKASYNVYQNATAATAATANLLVKKVVDEEISVRIQVTDAITTIYTTTAETVGAETVPGLTGIADGEGTFVNGLAKSIYESLSADQFEGDSVLVEVEPTNQITFANTLNLTGGIAAWTTMAAQLQSITKHYGLGTTEVSFGPTKHNNADALNQLIQWTRPRFVWYNPALRETASYGDSGGVVDAGSNTAKENTDHGSGTTGKDAVSGEF